jgi:hypothetical protein
MKKLLLVLLISTPTVASCDAQSSGKSNGAASGRANATASEGGGIADGNSMIDLKQQEQAAKAFERAANTTAHPPNGTNPRPAPPPPPPPAPKR